MAILSRFRSKKRDIETDVARVVPILDAVQAALRDAEREHDGLRVRLRDTGDRAAFLFGDGLESEADADPASKIELKEAEDFVVRGEMRNRYLERQITGLQEVRTILESIVTPVRNASGRESY